MKPQTAPTAANLMNRQVLVIEADMRLADIVSFLLEHTISNAPVIEWEGKQRILRGFVSEADCLEFLSNELFYGNPSPIQTAETIMKKHPTCVSPETDIFSLTSIFTSHHFRHLPVVEDKYLLGIVSRRDVLKAVNQYYRDWVGSCDRERFPVDLHQIMNHRFIVSSH